MQRGGIRKVPRQASSGTGIPEPANRLESAGTLFALSLAVAYGGGLWLVFLHRAGGGVEHHEPSLLIHWLRDSTLALPLAGFGAVCGASLMKSRLRRSGLELGGRLVVATWGAGLALAATLAMAPGSVVHALLFESQDGSGPPSQLHMLHDALTCLTAALPLALAVTAWAARSRPAGSPRLERARARVTTPWAGWTTTAAGAAVMLAIQPVAAAVAPAIPAAVSTAVISTLPPSTDPGDPCPAGRGADGSPFHRTFFVDAIKVAIPLNNYGDFDPDGKMYVAGGTPAGLEAQIARVRAQENDPAHRVTPGLQDDPIQPMVVRANEGDCVDVTYTDSVGDGNGYGLSVDGVIRDAGSAGDAIGFNPVSDGRSGVKHYRYWIPYDETLEGAHYAHPGPAFRDAVSHGLFGALVVEPPGSVYLDPDRTPEEQATQTAYPTREQISGQQAMIVPCVTDDIAQWCQEYPARHASGRPAQPFRDDVTILHEVGPENFTVPNRTHGALPFVDPTTGAYRPGSRAVNYRSEPFFNRLADQNGKLEPLAYNSYAFGDPATPVQRAYVADPVKIRLVHGGSEIFHVYHLHSGGLHWSLNPKADVPAFDYGDTSLQKFPDAPAQQASTVLDSQTTGPGESYNLELNHGAGGPAHSLGDFTYHCHIAEHYFAGMWGIRRVFDTLQPDLWELPDDATVAGTSALLGLPAGSAQGSFFPHGPGVGNTRQAASPDANVLAPIDNSGVYIPEGVDSVELLRLLSAPPGAPPESAPVLPDGTRLTAENLDAWIRPLLPPATRGDHNDDPNDPRGPRGDQDASTFDWVVDRSDPAAPLYLGERQWTQAYPDLPADAPHPECPASFGSFPQDEPVRFEPTGACRPTLLFNPSLVGEFTGRPAYPLLRSHVEMRPPFAPNGHSGAPYLGEVGVALNPADGTPLPPCATDPPDPGAGPCTPQKQAGDAPDPWAGRTNAVCPYDHAFQHHVDPDNSKSPFDTTRDDIRHFNIVEVEVPIRVTKTQVDADGALFTLAHDKDKLYRDNGKDPATGQVDPAVAAANPNPPTPLALRGDEGDCVKYTLTNEETDTGLAGGPAKFAMGNLHIHHVQFDVPGTDGSVIGYNYEMAIRPYRIADHPLTAAAAPGATVLHLGPSQKAETPLSEGVWIAVGQGTEGIEVHQIAAVSPDGSTVTLRTPLTHDHPAGEYAGTEFTQGEWYLNEPLDNIFFHDHTNGGVLWPHGAVGQIIVEPRGATFHDPTTGASIDSGPIADIRIHTSPSDPDFPAPETSDGTVALRVTAPAAAGATALAVDPVEGDLHPGVTAVEAGSLVVVPGGDALTVAADVPSGATSVPVQPLSTPIGRGTVIVAPESPAFPGRRCDQDDRCRRRSQLARGLVDGSFREMALWQIDGNPLVDSTLNLRAEPLSDRGGDPSLLFSSQSPGGDPFTPLPRAYAGDPFVIRAINVSPNVDTLHVDGHRFFLENRLSDPGTATDTIHFGPSERFTLILAGGAGARPAGGGPKAGSGTSGDAQAGDYLYLTSVGRRTRQGAWGIIRVLDKADPRLQPLPDRGVPAAGVARLVDEADGPAGLCPAGAPEHDFAVSAIDAGGGPGVVAAYALTGEVAEARARAAAGTLDPLVLHVAAGECVKVDFTNQRAGQSATFHVDLLAHKVASSGINVGNNPLQAVAPGGTRTYWYFADTDHIGAALISDLAGEGSATPFAKLQHGAPELSAVDGLYGAVVVSAPGATFTVPDGPDEGKATDAGAAVDVHGPGQPGRRDFTLLFADTEKQLGNDFMPYPLTPKSPALLNYRSAGGRADDADQFSSGVHGDPPTPVLRAIAGDPVTVHVLGTPGSDQTHVFTLGGPAFEFDHFLREQGGRRLSEAKTARGFGPWESFDAWVMGGSGDDPESPPPPPGDYFMGDLRRPFTDAGLWGLLRILDPSSCATGCPEPLH